MVGVVILLFAIYQLWGTSLQYARAQSDLRGDFSDLLSQAQQLGSGDGATDGTVGGATDGTTGSAANPAPATTPSAPTTVSSAPDANPTDPAPANPTNTNPTVAHATTRLPANVWQTSQVALADNISDILPLLYTDRGEAIARLRIPSIGVDEIVVEGTDVDDLRKGPGHYSRTPMPGQPGNVSIAGHRTTYGAPFGDIGNLRPGDRIHIQTVQGDFEYEVLAQGGPTKGNLIVTPDRVDLLADLGDNRLTLTSCHPRFSSRQRIVVAAKLIGDPVAPLWDLLHPEADDEATADGEAADADEDTGITFATEEFGEELDETTDAELDETPSAELDETADETPGAELDEEAQARTALAEAIYAAAAAADSGKPTAAIPTTAAISTSTVPPTTSATPTTTSATPTTTNNTDSFGSGLGGERAAIVPSILWALATLLVWTVAWLASRRWRKWPSLTAGLILVLPCLFMAFNYVDRAIPSY